MKLRVTLFLQRFCWTFILGTLFAGCTTQNTASFTAMDTFMTIKSNGPKSARANKMAEKRILELESYFSTTREGSDLYTINNSTNQTESTFLVHPETAYLVNYALRMASYTDGRYTPTLYSITKAWGFTTEQYQTPSSEQIAQLLPSANYKNVQVQLNDSQITVKNDAMLDLGSIAKGYSGDEIIKILKQNKINSAILDLGGNIQTLGVKPDGSLWRVGLKNPWTGPVMAVFSVKDCAIITSGGSERFFKDDRGNKYIHIFDGKTGYPVNNEIVQSTIVCSSGTYGDALSTTTFILGKQGSIDFWRSRKDFEMVLLLEDHSICYTSGLTNILDLIEEFTDIQIIE